MRSIGNALSLARHDSSFQGLTLLSAIVTGTTRCRTLSVSTQTLPEELPQVLQTRGDRYLLMMSFTAATGIPSVWSFAYAPILNLPLLLFLHISVR